MKVMGLLLAACLAVLAGCATTPPGAGWSRADDLSVYASLRTFAQIAREQEALCGGFAPASVDDRWRSDFEVRENAVRTALVEAHGVEAVGRAEQSAGATRSVDCPQIPTAEWRAHYRRQLRLLEMRMGL